MARPGGADAEQGAVAAAEGDHFEENAQGPIDDGNPEGGPNHEGFRNQEDNLDPQADGGEQEREPQEEPTNQAAAVAQPQRRRQRSPWKFQPWQLEELERVFQETHYPEVATCWELSKYMNVDEDRVKTWFQKRRVKHRRHLKESTRSDGPPGTHDHLLLEVLEGP